MPEETHRPELTAVEAALASLAPAPSRIDRDQLMFRAGQAAATRLRRLWPAATATLALLSAGLALALLLQPPQQQVAHVVCVPVELQTSPSGPVVYQDAVPGGTLADPAGAAADLSSYRLERLALRFGVDALPESPATAHAKPAWQGVILDSRDSANLLKSEIQ